MYYGPEAGRTVCGEGDRATLYVLMGLSVGWGDVYRYGPMWQWVDITGLGAGKYRLKGRVDGLHFFQESNAGNNCTWTDIRITHKPLNLQVLDSGPAFDTCP